ncbi:MAG: NAD(P)-dependent oxidoreductase [Rhodospirillaceae bacterium]
MADFGGIGIADCGAMGLPMARRLFAARFDVWGYHVKILDEMGDFAPRMIENPREFAAKCGIVISVVRDAKQTLDLCFDDHALLGQALFGGRDGGGAAAGGTGGPASSAGPGQTAGATGGRGRPHTFITCSNLSPRFVNKLDKSLPDGMTFLDAPMSGAPYRAENGTLSFMVGGRDADVQRLMPLFDAMGDPVHHLGPTGAGMTCKVVNNFVALTAVVAVRKALRSAQALWLDRRRLLEVMRVYSGATWYGDHMDDISWAREGYDPGNTIGILEKDLLSYLDAAPGGADDFEDAILEELRRMEALDEF